MRKILIFTALLIGTGCGIQSKSETDGVKLSQAEGIARLTDTVQWCGEDTDNDGSFSVNMFNRDDISGKYAIHDSKTGKSTSYPMTWNLQDDQFTRYLPVEISPSPIVGTAVFGKTNGLNFVKITRVDKSAEVLHECSVSL